jgi:hypothetical protein
MMAVKMGHLQLLVRHIIYADIYIYGYGYRSSMIYEYVYHEEC